LSLARDPGQLEAQRLAGSSRHHQQGIFALNHSATDRFLVWTNEENPKAVCKGWQAESLVGGAASIGRSRLNLEPLRSCGRAGPDSLCGDSRFPDFAHDLPQR